MKKWTQPIPGLCAGRGNDPIFVEERIANDEKPAGFAGNVSKGEGEGVFPIVENGRGATRESIGRVVGGSGINAFFKQETNGGRQEEGKMHHVLIGREAE